MSGFLSETGELIIGQVWMQTEMCEKILSCAGVSVSKNGASLQLASIDKRVAGYQQGLNMRLYAKVILYTRI